MQSSESTAPTSSPSECVPSVESESPETDDSDAIHATSVTSLPNEPGELESARRWLVAKAERQDIAERYGRLVQPGEEVCWTYCWDMARCGCRPTGNYSGVRVMPAARKAGRDRCLQCGKFWRPPGTGNRIESRITKRKVAA